MKKMICPQCRVTNLYVKNSNFDIMPVYVTDDFQVVASKEGNSLDGYNLETVYCMGCSWSGPPCQLKNHHK